MDGATSLCRRMLRPLGLLDQFEQPLRHWSESGVLGPAGELELVYRARHMQARRRHNVSVVSLDIDAGVAT
jgi:hypothetical protein